MILCFEGYEMGLYLSIIPTLIMLMEREISLTVNSNKINWQRLISPVPASRILIAFIFTSV